MSRVPDSCVNNCTEPCPFCTDEPEPRDHFPDCPSCGEPDNVNVDYGAVSWPDDMIPQAIKDGGTPFYCSCGYDWIGSWKR